MTTAKKLISAAGAGAGGATYVDDVFQTTLTEGLGNETIVNGMDLAAKGALIWQKSRIQSSAHYLYDSERGAGKALSSNSSGLEQDFGSSGIQSWNSDGWTAGSGGSSSGGTTAQWVFAKQEGFFDIVTYTGDGNNSRQIPHNLGSVPGMVIVKRTSGSSFWYCWHRNYTGAGLYLNDSSVYSGDTPGFDSSQSSTTFNLSSNSSGNVNVSGQTYVAYLFAHDAQDFGTDEDESIIKCGSYTGNNSADGPEIDLGWEPQFLLIKNSSGSGSWLMLDAQRGIVTDGNDSWLVSNASDPEYDTGPEFVNILANGFKVTSDSGFHNGSGDTVIYVAIRRPNKPAEEFDPDKLFAVDTTLTGDSPMAVSGFPVDMGFVRSLGSTSDTYTSGRLIQNKYLRTNSLGDAASNNTSFTFDHPNGFLDNWNTNEQAWMFRRAPGFFDVVTYAGTSGSAKDKPHSLAAVPEMMWVKNMTDATTEWMCYHKDIGATKFLELNTTRIATAASYAWENTAPTNQTFHVSSDSYVNAIGRGYIAYLWASVAGICNIGSYTGTGADLNIDCGFTNGARFVLIKRTDVIGDWYYWDTLRGIVAGNDPYLLLNSPVPQVTSTDYIDPLSSGFTVTSSAPAGINASSGEYIYMAIA